MSQDKRRSQPNQKKPKPQCVYCGRIGAYENEHVIAKTFFYQPLPKDMITVPSCPGCNDSFEDDDRYVKHAFTLVLDKEQDQEYQQLIEKTLRSFQRPQDVNLTRLITKTIGQSPVIGSGGLYLGMGTTFSVD